MRLSFFTILAASVLLSSCSVTSSPPLQEGAASSSSSASVSSVTVLSPAADSIVKSPLSVVGKAPNTWFFEGSLPVELTDTSGHLLAQSPASTKDDWMADGLHMFQTTLVFAGKAEAGFVVIRKDNPSGLPQNDAEFKVPVRFR